MFNALRRDKFHALRHCTGLARNWRNQRIADSGGIGFTFRQRCFTGTVGALKSIWLIRPPAYLPLVFIGARCDGTYSPAAAARVSLGTGCARVLPLCSGDNHLSRQLKLTGETTTALRRILHRL